MLADRLRQLRKLGKYKRLRVPAVVTVILLFVVVGVSFGLSGEHDASKTASSTSNSSLQTSKSTNAGDSSNSTKTTSSNHKSSSSEAATNAPRTKVIKTVTNSDGTTTKEISSTVTIPFSSRTQNDVNLKRGTTKVQAGQNGTETVVYSVTYDQNGKEIARKTISDTITKQPIDQVTRIGVSDFNLNADTWDGTEAGLICIPADYDTSGDGCVGVPSQLYFSAVEISGSFYVSCVSGTSSTCNSYNTVNVQPVAIIGSSSTFSYHGSTYRADPRKGGGMSQPLTSSLCSQYGLACGSW